MTQVATLANLVILCEGVTRILASFNNSSSLQNLSFLLSAVPTMKDVGRKGGLARPMGQRSNLACYF